VFYPVPQAEARAFWGIEPDAFVVLWLDRNQPRKRLDLAIRAFGHFAADKPHARLLLHTGVRDVGWNPEHEARKAGVNLDQIILTSDSITPDAGLDVDDLRLVYSAADVRLSTTAGEGWGLTIMEAMACGLPVAAPDWSALGEWAAPAALLYPVAGTQSATNRTGTDEAVIDPADAAHALEMFYQSPVMRRELRAAGLALVERECYRWQLIGTQFDEALHAAIALAAEPEGVAA
jgi:glycosyltransferase involved in cell wall biosynthesis